MPDHAIGKVVSPNLHGSSAAHQLVAARDGLSKPRFAT
jgi:hypothetical protein